MKTPEKIKNILMDILERIVDPVENWDITDWENVESERYWDASDLMSDALETQHKFGVDVDYKIEDGLLEFNTLNADSNMIYLFRYAQHDSCEDFALIRIDVQTNQNRVVFYHLDNRTDQVTVEIYDMDDRGEAINRVLLTE